MRRAVHTLIQIEVTEGRFRRGHPFRLLRRVAHLLQRTEIAEGGVRHRPVGLFPRVRVHRHRKQEDLELRIVDFTPVHLQTVIHEFGKDGRVVDSLRRDAPHKRLGVRAPRGHHHVVQFTVRTELREFVKDDEG